MRLAQLRTLVQIVRAQTTNTNAKIKVPVAWMQACVHNITVAEAMAEQDLRK